MRKLTRKRGSALAIIALALVLGLIAVACGDDGGEATTTQGTAATTEATTATTAGGGGTLVFGRTADIFTFDPYNTQDDRSIFTELTVYERLVKLSEDGKTVEPELATEWVISDDGLTADFTLREGVLFSDGTPMTVDDVVFSLARAVDQTSSWGFLFSPVTGVTAVDERTVRLTMSEPFSPLLPSLSTFAASIYSKANFEEWGDAFGEHPLGTAAFMLERWDKGDQVVLVRNPYYWQEGLPHLDSVIFKVVSDDNARVLQLQSGELDLIDFVPPNQIEALESSGATIYRIDGTAVGWMTINTAIPPLDEANVRCAMAYAVDREAIAQNVHFGYATPARSVLPSTTFFYDGSDAVNPVTYDLERARELLADSSVPDGFELTATVPTGSTDRMATAQIWAASLAEIGITLNLEQVEETTAQEQYNTEQFTIRISAWTNDTPDPDEMMGVGLDYVPQNALHTSYRNDTARDLVLAARAELDDTARQELYSQLQAIVNQDCPFIYTVEVPRLYASGSHVQGFAPNSQGKYSFEYVSFSS
jgi:peptide/nickel transport system substrate-binding protein